MKALIAVGDHYLKIDDPLGHFGNFPEGQRGSSHGSSGHCGN